MKPDYNLWIFTWNFDMRGLSIEDSKFKSKKEKLDKFD